MHNSTYLIYYSLFLKLWRDVTFFWFSFSVLYPVDKFDPFVDHKHDKKADPENTETHVPPVFVVKVSPEKRANCHT